VFGLVGVVGVVWLKPWVILEFVGDRNVMVG